MSDMPSGSDPDRLAMPIHAETLAVSRRRIDTAVRVSRHTVTTGHPIDEAVAHARVVVTRVPVGRTVEAIPPVREEGDTLVFPVVEEELVITRRLVLTEEVRVARVKQVGRHRETVVCREQRVTVTRTPRDVSADGTPMPSAIASPANIARTQTMTEETIVAVFDTEAHAAAAIADLHAANVPDSAIGRHAGAAAGSATASLPGTTPVAGYSPGEPMQERGFWSSLFGGEPDHDTAVYDRSLAAGSIVVTVRTTAADYERVMEILESHDPADIDERAAGYGLAQTPAAMRPEWDTAVTGGAPAGTMRPAATPMPGRRDDGDTLPLSEEQLAVGKRVVNHGNTRIRRFVVETPVEEQVTLHDERVSVERRPVTDGRPLGDADFTDRTIEMTESVEEPVVTKTARVVEEVSLRKQASERVETVRDTVRRQEVEIEQAPGATPTPRPPKI